eukprot:COSAG02_NODE_1281_length_13472_cov_8.763048_5_plen_159_part_00
MLSYQLTHQRRPTAAPGSAPVVDPWCAHHTSMVSGHRTTCSLTRLTGCAVAKLVASTFKPRWVETAYSKPSLCQETRRTKWGTSGARFFLSTQTQSRHGRSVAHRALPGACATISKLVLRLLVHICCVIWLTIPCKRVQMQWRRLPVSPVSSREDALH